MAEVTSEDIAHKKARQEWWKKLLKFAVPAVIILAIILVIFFDPRALAVSFVFIIAAILFVVFSAGGGKKKEGQPYRSHYQGRFSGVGGVGQRQQAPYNLGRPKDGSAPNGGKSSSASPYANPEAYEALVQMYHQHPPAGHAGGQQLQKGQQSSLGSKVSNTGVIIALIVGAIVLWLFG